MNQKLWTSFIFKFANVSLQDLRPIRAGFTLRWSFSPEFRSLADFRQPPPADLGMSNCGRNNTGEMPHEDGSVFQSAP